MKKLIYALTLLTLVGGSQGRLFAALESHSEGSAGLEAPQQESVKEDTPATTEPAFGAEQHQEPAVSAEAPVAEAPAEQPAEMPAGQ